MKNPVHCTFYVIFDAIKFLCIVQNLISNVIVVKNISTNRRKIFRDFFHVLSMIYYQKHIRTRNIIEIKIF